MQGRPAVRARHLEHEGRARLLRRGGARAAGRGRAAEGRPARRGRLRRDREGAVGRRAGRRVPRLRGRARATSSRTAASPTCASSASRPSRSSCSATSARSGCGISTQRQLHPHRLQRGQARPELDPAHARGARRGAGVDPDAGRPTPRTPTAARRRSSTSAAIQGGFGWRVSRTPHRTDLFLDVRVPPTKPMAAARGQVLDMARGLARRFPDHGVEAEVYVTAPGRRDRRGASARRAARGRARAGLRRAARAGRRRAGSPTPRR